MNRLIILIVMIVIVTSVMLVAEPIDALKSAGNPTKKYGSSSGICGDKLCSEIKKEDSEGSASQQSRSSMGVSQQGATAMLEMERQNVLTGVAIDTSNWTPLRKALHFTACSYGDGNMSDIDYLNTVLNKVRSDGNIAGMTYYRLKDVPMTQAQDNNSDPWIKNNAKWYCNGIILDSTYTESILHLMEEVFLD